MKELWNKTPYITKRKKHSKFNKVLPQQIFTMTLGFNFNKLVLILLV